MNRNTPGPLQYQDEYAARFKQRILADFADDEGALHFQLQTRVAWGRPLA